MWQSSLAANRLKVSSWFQGRPEPRKRAKDNRSADELAYISGINQLALTSTIVVTLREINPPDKVRLGLSRKSRLVLMSQRRTKLSNSVISDKAGLP